ncbi:unnamed protein product [Linum tenue]|uniref:30S ribosomal protein n=1 Tax=Linum tenue TaxID=586396 RepID=A0AAV0KQF7_9ROSI|nr:unnamed protein product [Linum tenue]
MASLMVAAVPSATPRSLKLCPGFSSSRSEIQGTSFVEASFNSLTLSASSSASSSLPLVYCGRGDRKTAKGKRFAHSFGNARPRNKKKGRGPPRIPVPAAPLNPDELVQDSEEVAIETDE